MRSSQSKPNQSLTTTGQGDRRSYPYLPRMPLTQIDPLELQERMSQVLGTRVRFRERFQRPEWFRSILRTERLPLFGLRSQRGRVSGRFQQRGDIYPGRRDLFDPLRKVPGTKTICQIRSERRQHLFKLGIAGRGKRRSPGQGGSYRRTAESYYHCQTIRR